ncbi:MAG TPA: CAP domain-containing protein [Candidatus Saccharimonadales bacterium]|jgi:hypothetical protein|nr:CAP domain-containing protein [Candidatus Saccharimonadales bacterium]
MKVGNILIGACIAIFLFLAASIYAQEHGPAQILFESANRERAAKGLGLLKWDPALAAAAHQHAQRMAEQNTLSHQLHGEPEMLERAKQAGAHFSSLAENVAEGPSAEEIHKQWMHSPPHRANLLDPQLNSIGIATADHGAVMFAVEDLSLATVKLSVEEEEGIVEAKLAASGLKLLDYRADARRSCVMDNGYAGSHTPSFVLHYATPDLQTLPEILVQRIQTGKYHSAVVGACPSDAKLGFSNFRIAVLLFE